MQKLNILIALTVLAILVVLAIQINDQSSDLKRVAKHETYQPGDDNWEFCNALCLKQGGVNCGGKRKGCCQTGHCKKNKIYGWDECDAGFSQKLGTDRCIGTWNTGN